VLRGPPQFTDDAALVERYDIISIDPGIAIPPLGFFAPAVRRLFAEPQR